MKLNIISKYLVAGLLSGSIAFSSCSDFTEIDQKGVNLLSTVGDLEQLLNAEYSGSVSTMQEISGDLIYAYQPLSTVLLPPSKTANSIIQGWDEEGHMELLPQLTTSDAMYASCYEYIGRIANPILAKIDDASGDPTTKEQVRAEAYVIRAFFHFLAVNKFAPAYDKSSAANTYAIAYVMEDQDIKQPTEPIMMDEFYNNILSDLDAAIAIDAFDDIPINQMRFGKVSAYAIKALALMCMQEPAQAAQAAQKALDIRGVVNNYNDMLEPKVDMIGGTYMAITRPKLQCTEDYFADYNLEFYNTRPLLDNLEDNHLVKTNFNTMNAMYAGLYDASLMMIDVPGLIMTYDLDSSWPCIGFGAPQMYLILAENAINNGNYDEAMQNLDKIRQGRIATDAYMPLAGTVSDKASAIEMLKLTANGEQFYNVWSFVTKKRWTRLADYKETYNRELAGINMTLTPDSRLWVFPIPQNVINNNPNFKPYLND